MKIDVYIYGCTTCGTNSIIINKLKREYPDMTVYNSAAEENRKRHVDFLRQSGIETQAYPAIIVINDGARIMRISEWKSI